MSIKQIYRDMKKFSDLGIKQNYNYFIGDKIKITKVLNQDIIVHKFKLKDSKFENSNSDKCLKIQIELKGEKYVLFTGSKILAETIQLVPEDSFPFVTTITKEGESFQFN